MSLDRASFASCRRGSSIESRQTYFIADEADRGTRHCARVGSFISECECAAALIGIGISSDEYRHGHNFRGNDELRSERVVPE